MTRYITRQELIQCIHDAVELDVLAEPGACLYVDGVGKTCAIGAALTAEEKELLVLSGANDSTAGSRSFMAAVPDVVFTDPEFADFVQNMFDQGGSRNEFLDHLGAP
jgi:hypothetical protein